MASKKINEILECSVCLDRFTRPKVLPCQHTYCYECLQSLAEAGGKKTTVQCPQCRKEYKIPDPEGVDGFPANLIINHLLSLNAESDNDESESTKSSEPISQGAECCDCKKKSLVATSDSSSDCHGVSAALSALSCSTQEATEGKNHSPDVNIKVGDRVRRRQTVTTPRYDWGEVTSASEGMVRSINGDEFVIDFPQSKNCIGVSSEIELVPDVQIKVGDRVRVKQTIAKPRNEWGKVARASVGFVRSIKGEKLTIDFPEQLSWNGILSEMEQVPDVGIKVGDKVRVKKTVKTPRNNWGKVTHGSVGIVKAIEGEKLKVDFPEQLSWNGLLSEMELAQDIIKVGDRVRVKPTIETPRTSWGNVSHGSVGIVKVIEGEKLKIDFPEQLSWNGLLSEMEQVPDVDIKVGDKVRVKKTVEKPRTNWGNVSHGSVGIVKVIEGEKLKIDFPEQMNWNGLLSEMELAQDIIKVGDRVRVKQTIETPRNTWGRVSHGSVGIVKVIEEEKLKIDFPEQMDWIGLLSEMEQVPDVGIKVGDKVRVKKTVEKPSSNWGSVTHNSVGTVRSIAGETVKIDFPEQHGWSGVMREMELAQ